MVVVVVVSTMVEDANVVNEPVVVTVSVVGPVWSSVPSSSDETPLSPSSTGPCSRGRWPGEDRLRRPSTTT